MADTGGSAVTGVDDGVAFGSDGTDSGVNLATEVTTDEATAGADAAAVVVEIAGAGAEVVGVVDGSVFGVVPVTAANAFVTGANALDDVEVVGVVDGSVVEVGVGPAANCRCRHRSRGRGGRSCGHRCR